MNSAAAAALARRVSQERHSGKEDARNPCPRGDGRAGATPAAMRRDSELATRERRSRAPARARWRLAAIFTLAFIASGCATQIVRTPEQRASDAALAMQVERALAQDPNIYARHIDVDADGGIVRLSGFVWAADDYYEAQRIAANVPGVVRVVDQLEMVVGGRTGAR